MFIKGGWSRIIIAKTFILYLFLHSDSITSRIGNTDENIGIHMRDDFYGIHEGGK